MSLYGKVRIKGSSETVQRNPTPDGYYYTLSGCSKVTEEELTHESVPYMSDSPIVPVHPKIVKLPWGETKLINFFRSEKCNKWGHPTDWDVSVCPLCEAKKR